MGFSLRCQGGCLGILPRRNDIEIGAQKMDGNELGQDSVDGGVKRDVLKSRKTIKKTLRYFY